MNDCPRGNPCSHGCASGDPYGFETITFLSFPQSMTPNAFNCNCPPGMILVSVRKYLKHTYKLYFRKLKNLTYNFQIPTIFNPSFWTLIFKFYYGVLIFRTRVKGKDQVTCEKVDPCLNNNGGCSHECMSLPDGNFQCKCPSGSSLRG